MTNNTPHQITPQPVKEIEAVFKRKSSFKVEFNKQVFSKTLLNFYAIQLKQKAKRPLSALSDKQKALNKTLRENPLHEAEVIPYEKFNFYLSQQVNSGILLQLNSLAVLDIDTKDGVDWKAKLTRLIEKEFLPHDILDRYLTIRTSVQPESENSLENTQGEGLHVYFFIPPEINDTALLKSIHQKRGQEKVFFGVAGVEWLAGTGAFVSAPGNINEKGSYVRYQSPHTSLLYLNQPAMISRFEEGIPKRRTQIPIPDIPKDKVQEKKPSVSGNVVKGKFLKQVDFKSLAKGLSFEGGDRNNSTYNLTSKIVRNDPTWRQKPDYLKSEILSYLKQSITDWSDFDENEALQTIENALTYSYQAQEEYCKQILDEIPSQFRDPDILTFQSNPANFSFVHPDFLSLYCKNSLDLQICLIIKGVIPESKYFTRISDIRAIRADQYAKVFEEGCHRAFLYGHKEYARIRGDGRIDLKSFEKVPKEEPATIEVFKITKTGAFTGVSKSELSLIDTVKSLEKTKSFEKLQLNRNADPRTAPLDICNPFLFLDTTVLHTKWRTDIVGFDIQNYKDIENIIKETF
jgi:hypothetical protein